jgi:hypothetical protein
MTKGSSLPLLGIEAQFLRFPGRSLVGTVGLYSDGMRIVRLQTYLQNCVRCRICRRYVIIRAGRTHNTYHSKQILKMVADGPVETLITICGSAWRQIAKRSDFMSDNHLLLRD